MGTTNTEDYMNAFAKYYFGVPYYAYFMVPYNYTLLQETSRKDFDVTPWQNATTLTQTINGYNSRKKLTLQMQRVAMSSVSSGMLTSLDQAAGLPLTDTQSYTITFSVYLYDALWLKTGGKNPWNLGLYRELYGFEDVKLFSGSVTFEHNSPSLAHPTGGFTFKQDDNQFIMLYYYSPITGKLDKTQKFQLRADNSITDYPTFGYNLWQALAGLDRQYNGATQYLNITELVGLQLNKLEEALYNEVSADAHEILTSYFENNNSYAALSYTTLDHINEPIFRLPRVSALNTGSWSRYPLGSSPAECTARVLSIPYNNVNFNTISSEAGVTQFLEAAEKDVMYAFLTNPANAGIGYSDLRAMGQAVTSYTRLMAAYICSSKNMPKALVPYVAAKIEYQLFTAASLPADIEAALHEILGYILEDYSINDTVANARVYYEKCRGITAQFGSFYSTFGTNTEKLGASSVNAELVMTTYSFYQALFLELAYVKEMNQLASTTRSTGTIELLNKSLTVFPRLQNNVYLGGNTQLMICTDITMTLTNKPKFSISANYMKRLEIS